MDTPSGTPPRKRSAKPIGLVGAFLRQRREALEISQKSLGKMLVPQVTTQFISNVERGVTPLPPNHIPYLVKILKISEPDLKAVLEKEYAQRLNQRLHPEGPETPFVSFGQVHIMIPEAWSELVNNLVQALSSAPSGVKQLLEKAIKDTIARILDKKE